MKQCTIEGCNNKHHARGWCNKHYIRWRAHGDPTVVKGVGPEECTIEGCNTKHMAKGYCMTHYSRYRIHGDALMVIDNTLPKGHASRNQTLGNIKRAAERRGYEFKLTDEQCIEIFESNCFYCGAEPNNTARVPKLNGAYKYNGIDRVDNTIGYVMGNVVPCCKECNYSKGAVTIEIAKKIMEFINDE